MVLRKPTPQDGLVPRPLSQAANNPPYPTTPATEYPPDIPTSSAQQEPYSPDLNKSPAFRLQPLPGAQNTQNTQNQQNDEESDYSDSDWDKSDDEDTSPNGLPNQLKIGGGKPLPASSNNNALPDALRAGPPPGVPIQRPLESDATGATTASWGAVSNSSGGSIPLQTNNPYLRMQTTGQSNFGGESSHLPLKINPSGVIPPIFATSLLLLPLTIASFSVGKNPGIMAKISQYLSHGQPIYILLNSGDTLS